MSTLIQTSVKTTDHIFLPSKYDSICSISLINCFVIGAITTGINVPLTATCGALVAAVLLR